MLGRRDPQRSFFGAMAQLGPDVIEKLGFYGRLAVQLGSIFRDEDFAPCYCQDNGRPSVPPSMLAAARLLQHYDVVSDAEVVDRCRFDARWKVALDLDLTSVEAPFAKSTFQAFRVRLTLHAKEGAAFERSIGMAKGRGLLPKRLTLALDSSPVRGKGAVKDTFNLLSGAIAAVIRAVARARHARVEQIAAEAGLKRHIGGSVKGSEVVDWDDQDEVQSFLGRLLEDCGKAAKLGEEAGCATYEVELLQKVIDQDIKTDSEDGPSIKQGVAKGRMPSVTDPEARHGHKSSGKTYTGHKARLAVDTHSGIITAVGVGSPGQADGAYVRELVEQSEATTGSKVEEALGDTAYSTREAIEQAGACQVELTTKMPAPPKGKLGPRHFTVSEDGKQATCPAGHPSAKVVRQRDGLMHMWSPALCGTCPLRQRCMRDRAIRRTLLVAPDFHDRRRREAFAASPAGRLHLRKRVFVEHAIGRVKNLGAGTARYFGQLKTKAQWLWTAAVVNLSLVWAQAEAQAS